MATQFSSYSRFHAGSPRQGAVTRRGRTTEALAGAIVLLVEDEALIAMELESALESAGATICGPFGHLSDALSAARDHTFDIAVLDVDLGGSDVFEVANILLELDIPFVFHTGHGQRQQLQIGYPNAPVCTKPFGSDRLISLLADMLP